MSRKRSTPRAANTVRDVDLNIPKDIQEREMQALFEAYGLETNQQLKMASLLKDLIHEFGNEINNIRRRRTRADDRKNLTHAIERLSEAQRYLKACGPIGQTITRKNISYLGEMFSAGWIRQAFPEFELPKETYEAVNSRSRMIPRVEQVYVEEHTLQERYLFARRQNISLVSAVLGEIQQSLKEALQQGKGRGGRSKAEVRHYFIMNLAEFWKQIGRDPWATGEFRQFSEHVLNYVGWPTSGLRATINKALADFSTRS
jgi:hypothetical protein